MSDRQNRKSGKRTATDLPAPIGYAPAAKSRKPTVVAVDFAAESVRELRELWTAKRPSPRKLPSFATFDALELRPWADNLAIYDVGRDADGQPFYRYRRVGVGVAQLEGADHSGKMLHDVFSPVEASAIVSQFNAAIDSKRPVDVHDTVDLPGGGAAKWDRIILPLSSTATTADELMVLTYVEELA